MSLENEIREFMKSLGVDVVGFAGPGRFDGPPSMDPDYMLKGAKSIISFALPFDVPAIYDYLTKKSAIPHNLDQYRVHQKVNWIGLKVVKFLEEKGYRAFEDSPNVKWRRTLNPLEMTPPFSHRYGAYISGIAAPGLSGNAVTKEYGAAVVLNSIFTDAVLESDPIMDPRVIYDNVCQHCMACAASCPTKMFDPTEEEYALINGDLYPRAKPRDMNLCMIGCGSLHAPAPNLNYSNWSKGYIRHWIGVTPDPEKQNILWELSKAMLKNYNIEFQTAVFKIYSTRLEEDIFENSKGFPEYEDMPGKTEGQKLRYFADRVGEILDMHVDDPLNFTCGTCMVVCGPNAAESQKRWKMIAKSGFVVFGENKEPFITHDVEEVLTTLDNYPYEYDKGIKRRYLFFLFSTFMAKTGFDLHSTIHKGKYNRKLKQAMAELNQIGEALFDPEIRENTMIEIGAYDGMPPGK